MSRTRTFALILAALVAHQASLCSCTGHNDNDNDDIEVTKPVGNEDQVELELLDGVEKHSSLIYDVSCIPPGGSCYLRRTDCCANSGCLCNRGGFSCHCKLYYFWNN